jgi:hypothetical protein
MQSVLDTMISMKLFGSQTELGNSQRGLDAEGTYRYKLCLIRILMIHSNEKVLWILIEESD